ncbi:PREDICTED: protein FAM150B-like [Nanorana parkeri]|uniref:protein FAM150B-like n=1 Tax=Nanorana parkeri TaxID=125878 RepID=UPI000854710E|nr:PREDICTED: protein FAM150B-like [Nanorana parkeri]
MRDALYSAVLAILLLLLSSGYCKDRTDSTNLTDKNLLNYIMKLIKDFKRYNLDEENKGQYPSKQSYYPEEKEDMEYGAYQEQRVEIVPRDLRMKEKFLKHLTGRLSFTSPNCNKHFRRLYNSTRDCTIPARKSHCTDNSLHNIPAYAEEFLSPKVCTKRGVGSSGNTSSS